MRRCRRWTVWLDVAALLGVGVVAYGLVDVAGRGAAALWVGGVLIVAAVLAARRVG